MITQAPLNLPYHAFRIKNEGDTGYIFDEIRKKYLVLTPEEWVRQHLVHYLVKYKNYPRTLIKLEGGLRLNSLRKRSDILIYDRSGNKTLLVECKAPSVKISQDTFDQIARYNFVHRVKWLLVSNGLQHYCCEVDVENKTYRFLPELPDHNDL